MPLTPPRHSCRTIRLFALSLPLLFSAALTAGQTTPDFGPNVFVFDASTPNKEIQRQCDEIYAKQERDRFNPRRYTILFKPGDYRSIVKVGFYTYVYGLGKNPGDVRLTGEVQSSAGWNGGDALVNFWRGCENLTITPYTGTNRWAVSQAAPMRRVHIKGSLALSDTGYSSGGFLADSKVDGIISSGSQQQWISRNCEMDQWSGGVWNMVFVGCPDAPRQTWPQRPYTVIEKTPVIREKPFLYIDDQGEYQVFVPGERIDSSGCSWTKGDPAGVSLPLQDFYIARADRDTAATLNRALGAGKHLLITPGSYSLEAPLEVKRADTIVMGLGMATLIPAKGNIAINVADVPGVKLATLLLDAGAERSPVLLQIGEPGSTRRHQDNPTGLYDVICRVGGAHAGSVGDAVVINSHDVIGDHAWIWRADHGVGAAWDQSLGRHGLVVNGNHVTYYGLFVEHFQKSQALWNGEDGRTYFFQCEMPYDPPTQEQWRREKVNGFPGYKVADNVTRHHAWGLGVYCVFKRPNVWADNAIEAPDAPGVGIKHAITVRLGGEPNTGIHSVVSGQGGSVAPHSEMTTRLLAYPSH
jgi:hypothetical protein